MEAGRQYAGVVAALEEARRRGDLGRRPVDWVIEHSRQFVEALDGVRGSVVDLGSGAGVPGLVIALDRPDLDVTLLDRRRNRVDRLELVRRRVPLENVRTVYADAEAWSPTARGFDAAVARGFGPPDATLTVAVRLVRPGGLIVISEPPPEVDRWLDEPTWRDLGLVMVSRGRVVTFRKADPEGACPT